MFSALNVDEIDAAELANRFLQDDYTLIGPGLGSEDVAKVIIKLAKADAGYDFVKLVHQNWTGCDNFSDLTNDFKKLFNAHFKNADSVVKSSEAKWFNSLPRAFKVYRGCEIFGWHGLSWTLDKQVAVGFAKGHRGIKLNNPQIHSTIINKSQIFFATNERQEQEIVWDPFEHNGEIYIEPFE